MGCVVYAAQAALETEHHVLRHRERVHQHEVLVDHTDAMRDRVRW
ncbi:MAG: hypothetical protein JW395_1462 [Nitrospira sp.]|nr:hypothetical protein [Nitrospira sp.]